MFLFSHVCLNYRANCPKPVSSLDWVPLFSLQEFGFLLETFQTLALLRFPEESIAPSLASLSQVHPSLSNIPLRSAWTARYFFGCPLLPSCVQQVMEKKCESDNKKRKESRMWVWFQGLFVLCRGRGFIYSLS